MGDRKSLAFLSCFISYLTRQYFVDVTVSCVVHCILACCPSFTCINSWVNRVSSGLLEVLNNLVLSHDGA